MKVAVLYGGKSGEHEIALESASHIVRGLVKDHDVSLVAITKKGRWFLQGKTELERIVSEKNSSLRIDESEENEIFVRPGGGKNAFFTAEKKLEFDVVFPVLHGSFGEDGTVQGLLEMADIPYVGCTTLASALSMDKEKAKLIASASGIPVVPYLCIRRSELNDSAQYDKFLDEAAEKLGFPLFVKPCCAGSSNGASKATDKRHLSYAIMEAFRWDDKVLVEKALNAKEIECSVTGNSVTQAYDDERENVKAYVPGEIIPSHSFYDFDAKYKDPKGAELKIPADVSRDMLETVKTMAKKVYRVLDGAGLSRVDFFIDKYDSEKLYFNEMNSMPGFTSISMFPKMCEKEGIDFQELLNILLGEALLRFSAKETLVTSR